MQNPCFHGSWKSLHVQLIWVTAAILPNHRTSKIITVSRGEFGHWVDFGHIFKNRFTGVWIKTFPKRQSDITKFDNKTLQINIFIVKLFDPRHYYKFVQSQPSVQSHPDWRYVFFLPSIHLNGWRSQWKKDFLPLEQQIAAILWWMLLPRKVSSSFHGLYRIFHFPLPNSFDNESTGLYIFDIL